MSIGYERVDAVLFTFEEYMEPGVCFYGITNRTCMGRVCSSSKEELFPSMSHVLSGAEFYQASFLLIGDDGVVPKVV